ncbi:MAG TPA: GAD-like domain-containing protein [Pyrinomonadaceae bacterium]|jgi:hypothetical protein
MAAFESFKKRYGEPQACVPAPAASIEQYGGKLPEALLQEWQASGWCRYGDGLFWIVNPSEYVEILSDWTADPEETYVISRTAFGGLIVWDDNQAYFIDVVTGDTLPMLDSVEELFDDMLTDDSFALNEFRLKDFEAAVARLGILEQDECYGYFPPLALGGPGTVETIRKIKLREHLHFLSQLT